MWLLFLLGPIQNILFLSVPFLWYKHSNYFPESFLSHVAKQMQILTKEIMNNLFPQRDIGYLIILFKNVFISTVLSCLLPNLELCSQKISATHLGKNVHWLI